MVWFIEVGAILAAIFILYLLIQFIKNPLHIIANSVIGIILFLVVNVFLKVGIPIDIWSVGVAAIGGILGVVLIFLLHVLGLGF